MSGVLNVGGGSKEIPIPEHYAGWEFAHVLGPHGFAEIEVPDVKAVFSDVMQRGLELDDMLYESPAGPITVNDVIYGHGRQIALSGNDFYAHKNAFTQASLGAGLRGAGFQWVFMGSGPYAIRALAFRQAPTSGQRSLMRLPS